jgi:hypothetical protein
MQNGVVDQNVVLVDSWLEKNASKQAAGWAHLHLFGTVVIPHPTHPTHPDAIR